MNQNEPRVTWNDNGWAASDGWVLAHCTNPTTGEYIGQCDVYVSVGTGLPAGAYLDAPPVFEHGKVIVRSAEEWVLLADHRGATAYNKQTRAPLLIAEFGELSAELTMLMPQSLFDVWDEQSEAWIKNIAAEQQSMTTLAQQQKASKMAEASSMIATLQDAVDLTMATPAEELSLLDWKRYRVTLTRIDVSAHPITWPPTPTKA